MSMTIFQGIYRKRRLGALARVFMLCLVMMSVNISAKAQINAEQAVRIGKNVWYFEDYVLSIWYFNQAIQAKPYLAEPYLYRAIAKVNLEDYLGAEADATTALERNPFLTDSWEVRGVARQNLGKDLEAIGDYNKALELLPGNRQLLFNKAMAQTAVEDYAGADSTYARIISLYPSFENARLGRARLSLARKDTLTAMNEIDSALVRNPQSFNAYAMRADILAQRGKKSFPEAISAADSALRLNPKATGLFINRAFMRYKLDDYIGAMSDYDHALKIEPYNRVALFNRGLLNTEVGANDRALEDFSHVLQLDGSDVRARYCRALIYAAKHRFKDAIDDINYVISAYPNFPTGYFLRSDFSRQAGDIRAANADLVRANRINNSLRPDLKGNIPDPLANIKLSDDETARREFASLLTIADNTDMREEYHNTDIRGRVQDRNLGIELEPIVELAYYSSPTELRPGSFFIKEIGDLNSSRVLRYNILVTMRVPQLTDSELIERHSQSIADYNSYLASHRPRAIDYIGRALDFTTLRNYNAAMADLDRAISLTPDFAPAYMLRAQVRLNAARDAAPDVHRTDHVTRQGLERGNYMLVIADLDEAIALTPLNPYLYYNKGIILTEMSEFDSAEKAFDQAIQLKPDFGEAYYNRAFVRLKSGHRESGISDLSKAGELGVVAAYNLMKRVSSFH